MSNRIAISGFDADGSSTAIVQYSAVRQSDVNTVAAASAANTKMLGIIQEGIDGALGAESASVVQFGESFCVSHAAFAIGDLLNVGATNGRLKEAKSSVSVGSVTDTEVTWTATDAWQGPRGDHITIEYRDPGAASQSLGIVVEGTAIIVNLKTTSSGGLNSTADEIKTAVAALPAAAAMVTGADTGTDDGSGTVIALAATRLAGGAFPIAVALQAASGAAEIVKIFVIQASS